MKLRAQTGFTLIEVVMALAILALSLTVLLEVQASSLANASRSRGMTIAAMLARSKMIDIEQKLFDDGFTMGEETDEGDFEEEGQESYKWSYRIAEIEIDLAGLGALCGESEDDDDEGEGAGGCADMLGSFGGPLESFTTELGQSVRFVELVVTWADGKYEQSMKLRALMTREDYSFAPAGGLPNMLGP